MKRFTQISNKETPKMVDELEMSLISLIENSLNISVEGDLDDYLSSNIGIEGKEELVEKLFTFITKLTNENAKILLEKVRYQGIDNVEREISMITEKQTPADRKKNMRRIQDLLEKGDDAIKLAERQANSIRNGEKAFYRAIAAEDTIGLEYAQGRKKDLEEIAKIFLFRSKQLGFKK